MMFPERSGKNARRETREKRKTKRFVVALAGNPNVGKSTVFNELTGMHQHTGNWSGKTVSNASGYYRKGDREYLLVDIPGTYSYSARSAEEEVARDFLCFGNPDAVIVVCDATCLERNLNIVLQTLEITKNVVVCINLMDEAKKKGIKVESSVLSEKLGVPVVETAARDGKGLSGIFDAIDDVDKKQNAKETRYPEKYEQKVEKVRKRIEELTDTAFGSFCAIRILCGDMSFAKSFEKKYGINPQEDTEIKKVMGEDFSPEEFENTITECLMKRAGDIYRESVSGASSGYTERERKIDKVLTGKFSGIAVMLLFLLGIFWLTVEGANYISEFLSGILLGTESYIAKFFYYLNVPPQIVAPLTEGVWRVLGWVVAVMLPPMAIFFPLFTLLEDLGYLPRIAFNLDRAFKKCNACGKQSLTMCMGFGCNAVGVTGCRIIDSPRERLIAMLTNSFVPCNGRFPALIALITVFFTEASYSIGNSVVSALMLTSVVLVGIAVTFLASKLLSHTVLKGMPSSFTLELPQYRRPKVGKVIVRSVFDRTLFVLARAVKAAAPAGLIIWLLANVTVGGNTLLYICSDFLDPIGRFIGLDGVILMAFILSLPANEIMLPLAVMAYTSVGTISEFESIAALGEILKANGWDWIRAVCVMLFSLMHWPCATTLMTIKKESGSIKWTAVAFILPTLFGIIFCFVFNIIARAFL